MQLAAISGVDGIYSDEDIARVKRIRSKGGQSSMMFKKWRNLGSNLTRYLVNDGPAQLINGSYNAYSMLYRGQISLGLPVSKELIVSQAEIRNRAVQKLALVLYHICLNTTTVQIARNDIKKIIRRRTQKRGRLRLTENVILLTEDQMTHLALKRFKVPESDLGDILDKARDAGF
jgi:hypothetical protein